MVMVMVRVGKNLAWQDMTEITRVLINFSLLQSHDKQEQLEGKNNEEKEEKITHTSK